MITFDELPIEILALLAGIAWAGYGIVRLRELQRDRRDDRDGRSAAHGVVAQRVQHRVSDHQVEHQEEHDESDDRAEHVPNSGIAPHARIVSLGEAATR